MRRAILALVLALSSVAATGTQTAISEKSNRFYPVKSISINEYSLGMTLSEAKLLAPVEYLGGNGFEAKNGGITYYLGVTPKGRVYNIQSSQPLGKFVIDKPFIDDLQTKLISKYGTPSSENGDLLGWELVENVERSDGRALPFTTMWMSAMTAGTGGNSDVTLELQMLDFRILWEDQSSVNREPRSEASRSIQF